MDKSKYLLIHFLLSVTLLDKLHITMDDLQSTNIFILSFLNRLQDCGYVFTKGPKAWAALPDSYSCPPCGAPKRRFKKVPKGSASGKVEVKKSWF